MRLKHLAASRVARFSQAVALSGPLVFLSVGGVALAAQTDISIANTPAPAAPLILGPGNFAARPGSQLLYTIAATGQKPLTFAATGLPDGVSLASDTGTISGTMPPAGTYSLGLTVTNSLGSAQRSFSLVSGDTLAQTPPMGWNSYDSFGATVTESEVLAAAQAEKDQLQSHGWNYVVVDYLWFDNEQQIDANGRFLPSKSRFPSATGSLGFKPLADKIHQLGLNFGIHIMRGIPRKAVSANSSIANSTYKASQAGNTGDACPWDTHMWGVNGSSAAGQAWYDSIFAQYAEWGIDFVKVDDLLNNEVAMPYPYHQAEVDAIRRAIDKTGRSIVLSLSPGPMKPSDVADLTANANMWRMVNDFWDKSGLSNLADVFTAAGSWQATSGIGVGHWPDADMLPLGYIGPRVPVHSAGPSALTHNEQVSVMSLWSMLPSPLIFGGNVPKLTSDATGPFTLGLLTNDEILAVDQDIDGKKGKRISQSGQQQVWTKDLSGARKVAGFFNRSDADVSMTATLAQLGITGPVTARDLWKRVDLAPVSTSISVTVPWRGAAVILFAPPVSGTGGVGGSSGAAGSSAVAGSGGAAGTAGSGGAAASGGTLDQGGGGSAGVLVSSGAPGMSGANAGGAAAESSGASNSGGSAGALAAVSGNSGAAPGPGSATSDSGCACSSNGTRSDNGEGLALFACLLVVGRRRRQSLAARH